MLLDETLCVALSHWPVTTALLPPQENLGLHGVDSNMDGIMVVFSRSAHSYYIQVVNRLKQMVVSFLGSMMVDRD